MHEKQDLQQQDEQVKEGQDKHEGQEKHDVQLQELQEGKLLQLQSQQKLQENILKQENKPPFLRGAFVFEPNIGLSLYMLSCCGVFCGSS